MKKEITVKFNTITPLWTGDAWQDNKEIRPSSLMGSLRFWFEVICYFGEICNKDDHFNPQLGRFEKEVNRKDFKDCLANKGNSFEAKIDCLLLKQNIPLPSIVFGTTNWKSLIRIKEIEYLDDFENKPNLPDRICINKSNYEIKENGDCPKMSNGEWSVFYFAKPYFYGNFEVVFEVEEEIVESIFYPLLTFMEKYGFWGGKWNIGYGRLKVLEMNGSKSKNENDNDNSVSDWRKTDFELFDKISFSWEELVLPCEIDLNFSNPLKGILYIGKKEKERRKEFEFYCGKEKYFEGKVKKLSRRFIILELSENINNSSIYETIKYLLEKKLNIRNCLRHICEEKGQDNKSKFEKECFDKNKNFLKDKEIMCENNNYKCEDVMQWRSFRHELLGERGKGSKILPYIYIESENKNKQSKNRNEQLKAGFLSIAGLLNLKGR